MAINRVWVADWDSLDQRSGVEAEFDVTAKVDEQTGEQGRRPMRCAGGSSAN